MRKRLIELFPELAPSLRGILSADDGASEGDGGGADPAAGGEGDGGEGPDKLKAALERERQRAAEQRRLAGQLKAQLEELKKNADPEAIRAAEARAREAEEKARDADRLREEAARKAREEAESTYSVQLQQAVSRAEQAERQLAEREKRYALESAFYASEGRQGVGARGLTFFELFYRANGEAFAVDPKDGQIYPVDENGTWVQDDETGKRMDCKKFMAALRDDDVNGSLFKPSQGAGSGGAASRSGNGRINPQGADFQSMSAAAKLQAVFGTLPARR
jgi:hypothetical protein